MISSSHERFIAECRQTSVLDPAVPLGTPHSVRPEIGPSAAQHFDSKRRQADYGNYWFPPAGDRPFAKSRERMAA
jgi:hypothetical protein